MLQGDQQNLLQLSQQQNRTAADFTNWLIKGFDRPEDQYGFDAFTPLYIQVDRERTTQVIVALKTICSKDSGFKSLACEAVEAYLDGSVNPQQGKSHAKEFWWLFGSLGESEKIEELARAALAQKPAPDTARTIIGSMLTTRIPPARTIAFLEDLKKQDNPAMGDGAYWHNLHLMHVLTAQFKQSDDMESRQQIWRTALDSDPQGWDELLDISKSAGRASLRSVARQIKGVLQDNEITAQPVANLKEALFRPELASATLIANKFG